MTSFFYTGSIDIFSAASLLDFAVFLSFYISVLAASPCQEDSEKSCFCSFYGDEILVSFMHTHNTFLFFQNETYLLCRHLQPLFKDMVLDRHTHTEIKVILDEKAWLYPQKWSFVTPQCSAPTQASRELITLVKLFVVAPTRPLEVFFGSLHLNFYIKHTVLCWFLLFFHGSEMLAVWSFVELSGRRCKWFIHQVFIVRVPFDSQD